MTCQKCTITKYMCPCIARVPTVPMRLLKTRRFQCEVTKNWLRRGFSRIGSGFGFLDLAQSDSVRVWSDKYVYLVQL
jgi:hypothetical protein